MARKTQGAPAFPGGLMRFLGRALLVCVVACLGFLPARAEAGTITFAESLSVAADVHFFDPFAVDGLSLLTVELTAEFFPALTLFVADDTSAFQIDGQGYAKLAEFQTLDLSITLDTPFELDAGSYLLAVSQQPFLFSTTLAAFETTTDFELTGLLEGCGGFLGTDVDGCGSGGFTGFYSLERTQTVPEPGTVSLLTLGGAVLLARRSRRAAHKQDTA